MRLPHLLLPLAAGLLAVPTLQQDPNPKDKFEYYHVFGTTPNEVRQSINSLGPSNGTGRRYDASTRSQTSWKGTPNGTAAGCTFASFEVKTETTYLLPQWRDEAIAANQVVQAWKTYLLALKRHETGHKKIALEGADSLRAVVGRFGAQADCTVLMRMASDSGRAIQQRVNEAQRKYDLDTQHGRSQGAVFPPPN